MTQYVFFLLSGCKCNILDFKPNMQWGRFKVHFDNHWSMLKCLQWLYKEKMKAWLIYGSICLIMSHVLMVHLHTSPNMTTSSVLRLYIDTKKTRALHRCINVYTLFIVTEDQLFSFSKCFKYMTLCFFHDVLNNVFVAGFWISSVSHI